MTSCKGAIASLVLVLALLPCFAENAYPQTPLGAQWVEGANVKVNHDATSELQNEESGAINPLNPDNAIEIYRDFRLGYRRIGVATTFDGGATWSDSLFVGAPAYPHASDPVMSYTSSGDILACVLSLTADESISAIHVYRSTNGGTSWLPPVAAVDDGGAFGFEDKQWMNVDRTGGTYNDRVYIPWTRFGANTNIMLVHSITPDVYSAEVQVSDAGNVQWPAVTVGPDGSVYVAWVSFSPTRIMLDRSTNGGNNWGFDRTVTNLSFASGNINGGITVFAFPAMEADITGGPFNGRLYVAYTDRAADNNLDLSIRRSTDNGANWTSPVRINDDPVNNHIDQFHPAFSINEDGILTAIWLDRRLDPNNYNWDCYMSHSFDGGQTWTANRRISDVSSSPSNAKDLFAAQNSSGAIQPPSSLGGRSDPALSPLAGLIGEYISLSTRDGVAQSVWTDTRNGNQDAYSARTTIGFAAPPLYLPTAGTITNNSQPTFSWGKTGATPGEIAQFPGTVVQPLHYIIEVDDDSLFGSIDYADSALVSTSHQFAGNLADGSWYWRVSAVNDSGRNTGYSEPHRQLTIDSQAPAQPTIIAPAPDSTVDYQSQTFQWTAVTKETQGTPVSYHLQVSQDSTFATSQINVSGLSGISYNNATPLTPAATYYCRVEAIDAATNSSGFAAPDRFHTKASYICGDADHSGGVDISDAVYLIQYIFSGGPAPNPLAAGDADCSGGVDISDAVYLIQYIFAGGAAPCANCP